MILGAIFVNYLERKIFQDSAFPWEIAAYKSLFKICQDLLSFAQEPVLGSIVQYYERWVFNKELTMMNEDEFMKYLVAFFCTKYYTFLMLEP